MNSLLGQLLWRLARPCPNSRHSNRAKLRGHDEVGLGTILGSNIFNGIFIIAVAAIIHPITVVWREIAIALVFGFVALVFTYPTRQGFIERRRGVLLLVLYAVYLATIMQRQAA